MLVEANEGLEGTVSHSQAEQFTTLSAANLSTSTKEHNVVGNITNGSQFTYTITINNTGSQATSSASFSDSLQSGSPLSLSYVSGSTTCSASGSLSESGGVVTLTGISVPANDSCTIDITVSVSSSGATPGDTIDNSATIVNPGGPSGTPTAPTVFFEESQIPAPGNKQLYLDTGPSNSDSTNPFVGFMTRDIDSLTNSTINLNQDEDVDDVIMDISVDKEGVLDAGTIVVNMLLSRFGNGTTRDPVVEFLIDENNTGTFTSIDSLRAVFSLTVGTPQLETITLTNPTPIPFVAGATFRLIIEFDNTNVQTRELVLHQATSGQRSEVIVPLLDPIEVTDVSFYDRSATDDSAGPAGCAATFSCGNQIDPGFVVAGNTI